MTFDSTLATTGFLQTEAPSRRAGIDIAVEAETERLLAGRTRDIRLRGAIMDRYQAWSWPRRAKIVRSWMLWVAGLNVFLSAIGLIFSPRLLVFNLVFMGLFVPAVNFVVHGLWRRPRGPLIEPLSLVVATLTTMVVYGIFGSLIGGYDHERYLTGALFLAAIALVVFDMTLTWSTALGVGALLIFALFQIRNFDLEPTQVYFSIAFFGFGVAATIAARRTSTLLAHKSFLLTVRDAKYSRALAEANCNLHRLATLDPMTGIANRRSVQDHTDRLWRDPAVDKRQVAVIMVDIDHFKRLNDAFGHAAGDACICQVADAMVASTRRGLDLVSRYGGEEFMVILTRAPAETVMQIAERIRSTVEALKISVSGGETAVLTLTVSLGVAIAQDGVGPETLATRADDALYEAKRRGRNRVCRWPVDVSPQAGPTDLEQKSEVQHSAVRLTRQ
ncbi:GGDEF domain-containing protein [Aureimonas sp. SA4125]|uniref:GGDEF domain-containing protein n=1 Tax=Aureimonas sp. SA4125 TaxID=2826993 RepID=UPI001CC54C85|nr:diguanylate cyclase [Aureimonas sp. SA4125]BDA82801.1 GGDEF domain-containing protein [Aureimonas sp. SA4125]